MMTATRLRELLDLVDCSQHGFARYLGINYSRVQRWASGREPIPDLVADWLELVMAELERNPRPEGWRQ